MRRIIGMGAVLLLVAGCTDDISGTWTGRWSGGLFSSTTYGGDLRWELEQDGDKITGTHSATGEVDCLASADIEATFDNQGEQLSGTLSDGSSTVSFEAAYEDRRSEDNRQLLTGSMNVVESDCGVGDALFEIEQ